MKLTSLKVRRMPGFEDRGFALTDLSGGLNLIVGANASGKTTACRAIRGLLWPETLTDASPVSLVGQWADAAGEVRIELEADRYECQRAGQTCSLDLPDAHLAECFTVTVSTLIGATDHDAALAAAVLREMAGGYDLPAVRGLDAFAVPRRRPAEVDACNKASRQVRHIQQAQQALMGEEARLRNLERDKAAAQAARSRLARLDDVRGLLDLRWRAAEMARTLANLPDGMDRLSGNEAQVLEHIEEDLSTEQRKDDDARGRAERGRSRKDAAALPADGSPDRIREAQSHLEALRDAEQRTEQLEGEIAGAAGQADETLGRLGPDADAERLEKLDRTGLDAFERLYRQGERLAGRRAAIEERLAVLGGEEKPEDAGALTEGIHLLRQWFEAGAAAPAAAGTQRLLVWVLAGVLAASGVVLAAAVSPWWLTLSAVAAAAVAVALGKRAQLQADGRQAARERYERLGLDAPAAWDPPGVGRHLNSLERRLTEAHRQQQLAAERRARQVELDRLAPQIAEAEAEKQALADRLGAAAPTGEAALAAFVGDLLLYRRARDAQAGLAGKQAQAVGRRDAALAAVNDHLRQFGLEPCDGHGVARVRCEAIAERARQLAEAEVELAAAGRDVQDAQRRIEALRARRAKFYANLQLPEGDRAGLERRLEKLTEYRDVSASLGTYRAQEAAVIERLSDAPDLREMTREALDAEDARLGELAERHQELIEQIADINARTDQARRQHGLEQALAELDAAGVRLTRCRHNAIVAAAGRFLLDRVEAEQRSEHQPAVFRQARQWFAAFTRGRYHLRIGDERGEQAFRAYDNTARRGLALDELSGGTRMQLLLAVRLAFAADAERDTPLPFVLDEVLSGSDPIRFRAIVECVLALVGDGRQLFYFTCQPGDAEAWGELAAKEGFTDVKVMDLGPIRDLAGAAAAPGQSAPALGRSAAAQEPLPDPAGRTLAEYAAEVGAWPFDPAAGAGDVHVAHVLDSAEQLHALLSVGVRTCGPLRALLAGGGADPSRPGAYLSQAEARRAAAKIAAVEAICQAWSVGRGRPLSREALTDAGVTDNYIDRVADVARHLAWDARRLVEALELRDDKRAKGFQRRVLDTVVENFIEAGYLDQRPPLAKADALTAVLAATNQAVLAGDIPADELAALFDRLWPEAQ